MDVGFGHPYKLYQKLLCLLLVCISPTLSVISTLSQQGILTICSLYSDWQWYLDLAFLIYSMRRYCVYLWCTLLQCFQVFLLLTRMESKLFGMSAQTDNGNRNWHPYILHQKLLCLLLACNSLTLSGISTISQEEVSTLWSVSSDWQRYWDLALLIYSTRSYCAYFWCAPLHHF